MGNEILVKEQIDAGAEFVRDFNDYVPVSVACWVAPADSESRYLYIASDELTDANIRDGYGEVWRRLHGRRSPWLDLLQIKLVHTSDRVARDAIEFRDLRGALVPMPYRGTSIGGIEIKLAVVYPPVAALNATP